MRNPHTEQMQGGERAEPAPARGRGTVHLVEDDASVVDYLGLVLKDQGLSIRRYPDAERFLEEYAPETPECLLLDVRLPGRSGLELIAELHSRGIDLPTVVMTAYGETRCAVEAMKLGALEFLEKPFSPERLLATVADSLRRDLEEDGRRALRQEAAARFEQLSAREREVLELVVAGHSSKVIATMLSLSKKTVDTHRANILRKLGVDSLVELIRLYERATGGSIG